MDSTPLLHDEAEKREKVAIPINGSETHEVVTNGGLDGFDHREVVPIYIHLNQVSYFLGKGQRQVQILHEVSISFR